MTNQRTDTTGERTGVRPDHEVWGTIVCCVLFADLGFLHAAICLDRCCASSIKVSEVSFVYFALRSFSLCHSSFLGSFLSHQLSEVLYPRLVLLFLATTATIRRKLLHANSVSRYYLRLVVSYANCLTVKFDMSYME